MQLNRFLLISALFAFLRLQAAPILGPWVPLFKGIDHQSAVNTVDTPDFQNLMAIHALRIDLHDPDIQFLSTPRLVTNYQANVQETAGMTVSGFLKATHVQAAINANFYDPPDSELGEGTPRTVRGLAISKGEQVSPASAGYAATLMIDATNHAKIIPTNWPPTSTEGIWTAVSGDYPLLVEGVNISRKYLGTGGIHGMNPRTAMGLSQDRRYLYLLTIDGRQPGYSEGAYDFETAGWLLLLGAYHGFNLDGGGSTTLSIEDSTGRPLRLNRPSFVADNGKERIVGSHLGVFAKPVPGFINDVHVSPDDEAATVFWTTISAASSVVEYGLSEELGSVSRSQATLTTNHAVVLTGLQPGTGYYFRAVSLVDGTRYATSNLFFTTTHSFVTNQVLALTDSWKFTSANLDGDHWTTLGYDDSTWSGPGAGLLWVDVRSTGPNSAVGPRGAEMPFNPSTSFPYLTYYFRTHFQLPAKIPLATLRFSGYIDDGAVLYLNGHEIYRLRMEDSPATISHDTLSKGFPCGGDADCLDEFEVSGALADFLVAGDNLLAAEVHNYNPRSADITFGLSVVDAQRIAIPARIEITRSGSQATLNWSRSGFILQQTKSLTSAWTDVPGPIMTGPFVPDPSADGETLYYRLRK